MITSVPVAGRPVRPGRRAHAALLAALLVPASVLPAAATTLVRLSLDQITAASDTIVEGRVVSVRSYWQGKQILTEVGLSVAQSLKGPGASRLSFVQVGGSVSAPVPVMMTVPGAPIHAVGDEGFYFLQPGAPGQRIIVGLSLGRVPIRRDGQGPFIIHQGRRFAPSEFADEVRRILAGQAARPAEGADR
jgi:hypothetical protein